MCVGSTPFGSSFVPPDPPLDIAFILAQLPPLNQARELVSAFAQTMQQMIAIFHMPSTQALVEQAYDTLSRGETPHLEHLLSLFVVFSGAAHGCTPQMLQNLGATEDTTRAAFSAYSRIATKIAMSPLSPSTSCLAAMASLLHLLISSDGVPMAVHDLRSRCLLMTHVMQLHRLDSAGRQAERRQKGCDMVEVEVQRRIWWDIVATDWWVV